jgi:polyhydroxyalkanoate synthesis regulator phasin
MEKKIKSKQQALEKQQQTAEQQLKSKLQTLGRQQQTAEQQLKSRIQKLEQQIPALQALYNKISTSKKFIFIPKFMI